MFTMQCSGGDVPFHDPVTNTEAEEYLLPRS